MRNPIFKRRILAEIESLITQNFPNQKVPRDLETLHKAILKKHYNAATVSIDYKRRRIKMEIVMDDRAYDPTTINTDLPLLLANLWFRNLGDFLRSCLERDNRSLAFYSSLLKSYQNKDSMLVA